MNLLITGGTGFIGIPLIQRLLEQNHSVTLLARSPEKAAKLFQDRVTTFRHFSELPSSRYFDGVINLAGESVGSARWTNSRKRALLESRVTVTRQLVEWMQQADQAPRFLLSGSASGFYGDMKQQSLTESHPGAQRGFTHELCRDWEEAALQAEAANVRVCLLRTALVLDRNAAALRKMALPIKLGVGGPVGDGQQYLPWIHLHDEINAILFLMEQQLSGPINLCAPEAVTNEAFSRALAHALHRPALLRTPAIALKILLGEQSCLILDSARMVPDKLIRAGFQFRYSNLQQVLPALV